MKRLGVNKYECTDQEDIQFNFDCNPSRENVEIKRRFDDGTFEVVHQNVLRFKFLGQKRKLTLIFSFLVNGNCDIEITTVTPQNDTDSADSSLDIPVQKDYLFFPKVTS